MLKADFISFDQSKALNKLLNDYLHQKPELRKFYSEYPSLQGFEALLNSKPYSAFDRKHLVQTLTAQANTVSNTGEKTLQNIQVLLQENSFTVTSGHQLCLFTGPLYFIYKLFSAINLAEELHAKFRDKTFVPVYWMATEDHDFEEINHFYVNGEKLVWQSKQKGAVGDFSTDELKTLLPAVKKALGKSAHANYLYDLFERAYTTNRTLATATRYLVNELFAEYGLVIIDGNDAAFKKQFVPELKNDLFTHKAHALVSEGSAALAKMDYHLQVNAREINLFMLAEQSRLRIERSNNGFKLQDENTVIAEAEIQQLLKDKPEVFSPNVILRPLYQQKILPNLAYIGGPGELAYWLQFKAFFDAEESVFPILVPRNFVSTISASADQKMKKMGLQGGDLFKSEEELIKQIQLSTVGLFELQEEEDALKAIFENIRKKASENDRSLDAKVAADLQRALNAIESTANKVNRSRRRKMLEDKARLQYIKESAFVANTPRERHDNFSNLYLVYGSEFFTVLKKHCYPLQLQHLILTENAD